MLCVAVLWEMPVFAEDKLPSVQQSMYESPPQMFSLTQIYTGHAILRDSEKGLKVSCWNDGSNYFQIIHLHSTISEGRFRLCLEESFFLEAFLSPRGCTDHAGIPAFCCCSVWCLRYHANKVFCSFFWHFLHYRCKTAVWNLGLIYCSCKLIN